MHTKRTFLLVESDPLATSFLVSALEGLGHVVVQTVASAEEATAFLQHNVPNYLLIDVHLAQPYQGLGLLEELRPIDLPFILVAQASDEATCLHACQAQPLAFLPMPFHPLALQAVLQLHAQKQEVAKKMEDASSILRNIVFVKSNNVIQKVRIQDILYVQAEGNYSTIVLGTKRIAVKMSLSQMSDLLENEAFVQIHRNYLVRIGEIDSISLSHNELTIHGHTLPISRQKFRDDLLRNVKLLR